MSTRAEPLDTALLARWPLPAPDPAGDKESRGRVVVIAGSRETPGAAMLSARAALRAGAGKVMLVTGASVAVQIAVAIPELRVVGLPETAGGGFDAAALDRLHKPLSRAGAVLIGPGMLEEDSTIALALEVCRRHPHVPALLDATAMGAATRERLPGEVLLTPHAGEMAHLTGERKEALLGDPHRAARAAALRWQAVVALKGATTVIAAPAGEAWVHEGGEAGLATAGSGDVLAGLMAGFAARGATLPQAAAWGVAVHARAGARLAGRIGHVGYYASELLAEVPALLEGLAAQADENATPRVEAAATPARRRA